jgi:hypothetical protein
VQRHRQRVEDEPGVEADDRIADEDRELADDDVGHHRYQVPDDPRLIRDDGTLVSDADGLTWAQPSSGVSASAEPVASEVATTRGFSWGQVLILLAGAASLVFGIGAVALAAPGPCWCLPVSSPGDDGWPDRSVLRRSSVVRLCLPSSTGRGPSWPPSSASAGCRSPSAPPLTSAR